MRVANVYAIIVGYQQDGICLLNEPEKAKCGSENITQEEVKG